MIKYSPKAAVALGYLKRFYNDLEIFVEDRAVPNVHVLMIRRIVGPGVRLTSVTALGGRIAVLEACKNDQAIDGRRKLYVIDGDFDACLGIAKPRLRHLYRFRAYSVECLLLAADAVYDIFVQCDPMSDRPRAEQTLRFEDWLENCERALVPLFVLYATVFRGGSANSDSRISGFSA